MKEKKKMKQMRWRKFAWNECCQWKHSFPT